jgi:hypothetical protein
VNGGFDRHARALTNLARGRPIVFQASRAFNLAGAGAFRWFRRRSVDTINEDHVRVEFLGWLKEVDDAEITRFIEAMGAYRHALKEEVDLDPPQMGPTERGAVLRGDSGRIAWRKIQKLAGAAAIEALERERSVTDGQKRGEELKRQGQATKTQVLLLAQGILRTRTRRRPTPSEAAKIIAGRMGLSDRHVHRLLDALEKDQKISFDTKGAHVKKRASP